MLKERRLALLLQVSMKSVQMSTMDRDRKRVGVNGNSVYIWRCGVLTGEQVNIGWQSRRKRGEDCLSATYHGGHIVPGATELQQMVEAGVRG